MVSIPSELGYLNSLQILRLDNNEFNNSASLSMLGSGVYINISDNKLGFSSIGLNLKDENGLSRGGNYVYSPQGLLDISDSITRIVGDSVEMRVSDDYVDNEYSWYKNGDLIEGATDRIYSIESLSLEDSGNYWAIVTNPGFSNDFAIWRDTITLIIDTMDSTNFSDTTDTMDTMDSTNLSDTTDMGPISGLLSSGNSIVMYPNPVLDRLHIRIDNVDGLNCSLELVDSRGVVVLKKLLDIENIGGEHSLDVSFLEAGMYYAVLNYGDRRQTLKILKQ